MMCSVAGCERPHYGKGFCRPHYARVHRTGSTDGIEAPFRAWSKGGLCAVAECPHTARRGGLCNGHSAQKRYASLKANAPLRPKAKRGDGSINGAGYRTRRIGGKNVLEHRLLAERFLGRRLTRREQVHHRNGQRAENTIGPCFLSPKCECGDGVRHNLEMWSTLQPGQRICDKLAYAHELIAMYGDDETDRECEAFVESVVAATIVTPIWVGDEAERKGICGAKALKWAA